VNFAGSGNIGCADGKGNLAKFNTPSSLAVNKVGDIFVCDFGNNKIRKITPEGVVSTVAGNGRADFADGKALKAVFNHPRGLAVDNRDGSLYVVDQWNHRIRKITINGDVTVLAGTGKPGFWDGPTNSAQFNNPSGIAVHPNTGDIYVADTNNNRIRKISLDTKVVSTVAGNGLVGSGDGELSTATFNSPQSVQIDYKDWSLLVADYGSHKLRKISQQGVVSTIFYPLFEEKLKENVLSCDLDLPSSIAIDQIQHVCYITEEAAKNVKRIDL